MKKPRIVIQIKMKREATPHQNNLGKEAEKESQCTLQKAKAW